MKRIALISEHASPLAPTGGVDSGGQNIYVAAIANEFIRHGVAVDVFTRRDNPLRAKVTALGPRLRVIHLDAGPPVLLPKESLPVHMPAFAEELARFIDEEPQRYDCIHANFFMSAWAAIRGAKPRGIPLVTTFHALGRVRRLHQREADGFADSRFDMEDEAVRLSDLIVAECDQDRADLLEHYGADPKRIVVVPCGVDIDAFRPMDRATSRRLLGWPADAFIVLQLGRIVRRKGIETVIDAMAHLKRSGRDARCFVVGGASVQPNRALTPEIGRLEDRAVELDVADRVTFVGRRNHDDLARCFSAADVFVTTPWYEPFGITPLEAMACAVPVIGSAVGGIRTTVVDGVTGFHVPPRDAERLAQRIAVFMNDPLLRREMGTAGRARVVESFTWSAVGRQLLDVYRRAAGRSTASVTAATGDQRVAAA